MTHNGKTCAENDRQSYLNFNEVGRLRMRLNDVTAILGMAPGVWHDEALKEVVATLAKDHARAQNSVQVNENTIRRLASALKYWSGRTGHADDDVLLKESAAILSMLMAEPEPEEPSVVLRIDGTRHDLTASQRDEVERLLQSFLAPSAVPDDHHPYPL